MHDSAGANSGRRSAPARRMTVRELANRARVTPDVVRYYVRIGLLQPERDKNNGYKLFHEQHLMRIRFIRQAKRLGFTLNEIKQILVEGSGGRPSCPRVQEFLERHIRENRRKLLELAALQSRMEQALARLEKLPDQVSGRDSICYLIDATANAGEEPGADAKRSDGQVTA